MTLTSALWKITAPKVNKRTEAKKKPQNHKQTQHRTVTETTPSQCEILTKHRSISIAIEPSSNDKNSSIAFCSHSFSAQSKHKADMWGLLTACDKLKN